MEKYNSSEVKELLTMLRAINKTVKKKSAEPDKLDKQIKYLEQRLNFFNPTKEMLSYIINQAQKGKVKLDPILLQKLKDEYTKKL